jgi:transcriptional regulator with XRE-family HTH domain
VLDLSGPDPDLDSMARDFAHPADHAADVPDAPADPLAVGETLGEALRAAREAQGLALDVLAARTRVRESYLEAIENTDLAALPSRPFTLGYIRAYAAALGLEADAAVERFKTEEPVLDEPLRAPVGVLDERDPRVAAFLVGALVIIVAIVLWNVAQRAMMANAPPPPLAPEAFAEKALRNFRATTAELGAPLPAPVESTTPPPYETPGMAEALGLESPAGANKPAASPAADPFAVDLSLLPKIFEAQGKVYDAGGGTLPLSPVVIQALKPASLILRGADGSVYFARQLSKGDAVRIPVMSGLTIDVSNARDLQVFVNGQTHGLLPANQVLASKLAASDAVP